MRPLVAGKGRALLLGFSFTEILNCMRVNQYGGDLFTRPTEHKHGSNVHDLC